MLDTSQELFMEQIIENSEFVPVVHEGSMSRQENTERKNLPEVYDLTRLTVEESCEAPELLDTDPDMDSNYCDNLVLLNKVPDFIADSNYCDSFVLRKESPAEMNADGFDTSDDYFEMIDCEEIMQEILSEDYFTAVEAWNIPDSLLFVEPVEPLECSDFLSCPEVHGDYDSIDPESFLVKSRKRGGRRHKGQFMKRPMAMSEAIEELQNSDLRENALRCLSGHLIERREQDPEFYRQAGFFLFNSCGTVAILLQEILVIYERFHSGDLTVRGSKRLSNVLTLLQSMAANNETRARFVKAGIPNYLIPFIRSGYTDEIYENLRAISISVIGILCQGHEKEIIKWALASDIIDMCFYAMDIGSELSKVLSMTIFDSILRFNEGLSAVCDPSCDDLPKFLKMCSDLVSLLAIARGFSPRLLFLIVRCYILLCQNSRALELLRDQLPSQLLHTTFQDLKIEYPLFGYLRHQLLLNIGKAMHYLPSAPGSLQPSPESPIAMSCSNFDENENIITPADPKTTAEMSALAYVTPMRPVDLNKEEWSWAR